MNRVKLYLLLVMSLITFALNSQSLNGDWEGFLNVSGRQLKIVFHISDGDKIVTMDSPSQNAYGIKCVSEYLSCDSLAVSIPQLKVLYSGCRVNDNISGTFNQAGLKLPLMLKKE